MLFDYFSDIFRLYASIESPLRINYHKWATFAESVTSCFNKAYFVTQFFCLKFYFKFSKNILSTGCGTACTGTDQYVSSHKSHRKFLPQILFFIGDLSHNKILDYIPVYKVVSNYAGNIRRIYRSIGDSVLTWTDYIHKGFLLAHSYAPGLKD